MRREEIEVKEGYKCFLRENGKLYTMSHLSSKNKKEPSDIEVELGKDAPCVECIRVTKSGYHYCLTYEKAQEHKAAKMCRLAENQDIVIGKIEIIGSSKYDGKVLDLVKKYANIPQDHIRELCCHSFRIIELFENTDNIKG